MTNAVYVTPEFFSAMRIPVRRGRTLDERDRGGMPRVIIVNEAFVRFYLDRRDPIGTRIRLSGSEREIVGVVGDVQVKPGWGDHGPLSAMPLVYMPVSQTSDSFLQLVHGWFAPAIIVRSSMPVAAAVGAMRRAVDAVDPLLPFAEVREMSEVQATAIAQQRFLTTLLIGLAAAAVLLAAIGLHGLMATTVAERTREMGIRIALGATRRQALRMLALPGIGLTGVGTALGLVLAGATARLIRHFVWGVSAADPVTFVSVAVMLLGVACVGSLMPALRILRLDPAATLRHE
jgi:hypothetical protein